MSKTRETWLAVGAVLLAMPLLALVVLLNADWNRARSWLNTRTSEAMGREFVIAGDLSLHWQRQPASDASTSTWRDRLPWPHLVAQDIELSNPSSMTALTPRA